MNQLLNWILNWAVRIRQVTRSAFPLRSKSVIIDVYAFPVFLVKRLQLVLWWENLGLLLLQARQTLVGEEKSEIIQTLIFIFHPDMRLTLILICLNQTKRIIDTTQTLSIHAWPEKWLLIFIYSWPSMFFFFSSPEYVIYHLDKNKSPYQLHIFLFH